MTRDHLVPADDGSVAVDAAAQAVHEERAVAAAADVVFAGPDHLDGSAVLGGLEDLRRLEGHVALGRGPAAEAAAREQRVDRNLLGLQPQHLRPRPLVDGLQLRAEGQRRAVRGATDDAVVRLHRRVSQIGEGVVRLDHARGAGQRRLDVAVVARDRARRLDPLGELGGLLDFRMVAGPVDLVQGGRAFINRTPIYVSDPHAPHRKRYWGLASVAIDISTLFREAGLAPAIQGVRYALRGKDGLGAAGAVFFGDPALFNAKAITMPITLPSGSWQLAALPVGGWNRERAHISLYFLAGFIVSTILAAMLYLLLRERHPIHRLALADAVVALQRNEVDVSAERPGRAERPPSPPPRRS